MKTLKTTLVSALTLGAMTVTFAGEALADHKQGRGGKGRGYDLVDVYVDAGHNRQLERIIGQELERYNPYVNIVYSPRYADVTVKVNGYLSKPYRGGKRSPRTPARYIAMDYDYKIKVKSHRGETLYKDRIYGYVSEPLRRKGRGYYHNGGYNSYGKEDLARDAIGILVDVIGSRRDRHYRQPYGYKKDLTYEAYLKVAEYVSHIKIPRRGYGRRHR